MLTPWHRSGHSTEPSGVPCASSDSLKLPTYPRAPSKGEEMPQLAGGSGLLLEGSIPEVLGCCFPLMPSHGGFGGCHGCGSCSRCPHCQRSEQFLLLSSHRQGSRARRGTGQQQNLSFFTVRVVFTSTGTGCLERRWIPQPWKYSRPRWMRLGTACGLVEGVPACGRRVGQIVLKVPFSPNHSMFL